jgi:hypothetical protein
MKIETLMWLFPVLFMVHELGQIVFLKAWIGRNRGSLSPSIPLFARALAHIDRLSTAAFTLAAAEEFVLVSIATLLCVELELFNLFAGLLAAFILHLVVHAAQVLLAGRHAPVIVTTLAAGVYAMFALQYLAFNGLISPAHTALYTALSLCAFGLNFVIAHFLASYYDVKIDTLRGGGGH